VPVVSRFFSVFPCNCYSREDVLLPLAFFNSVGHTGSFSYPRFFCFFLSRSSRNTCVVFFDPVFRASLLAAFFTVSRTHLCHFGSFSQGAPLLSLLLHALFFRPELYPLPRQQLGPSQRDAFCTRAARRTKSVFSPFIFFVAPSPPQPLPFSSPLVVNLTPNGPLPALRSSRSCVLSIFFLKTPTSPRARPFARATEPGPLNSARFPPDLLAWIRTLQIVSHPPFFFIPSPPPREGPPVFPNWAFPKTPTPPSLTSVSLSFSKESCKFWKPLTVFGFFFLNN